LLGAPASLVTLGGLIVGVGIFSFCDQFSRVVLPRPKKGHTIHLARGMERASTDKFSGFQSGV
jgi:hypothetical protein